MNYGKAIKDLRVFFGENQEDFSHNVGISQGHLSAIEKGNKNPSPKALEKISKYTRIPTPVLSWLAIEDKDVHESKKEAFELLKPNIDNLISYFL